MQDRGVLQVLSTEEPNTTRHPVHRVDMENKLHKSQLCQSIFNMLYLSDSC